RKGAEKSAPFFCLDLSMQQELPRSAWGYFASIVESYDSLIRRAVPRYDEMVARLLEYLPHDAQSLVELGCGTGTLSLQLLAKFPRAPVGFIDASPEMIALTRARVDQLTLSATG